MPRTTEPQTVEVEDDETAADLLPDTYERGESYPTFECAPPADPEPVEIVDGVKVVDARVQFRYNSDPSLIIAAERRPKGEDSYPAPETERGDVWLTQTSGGVIYSFQEGPAHPPADTSPRQPSHDVTHESLETQKRAKQYSHETANLYNSRDDLPGLATQQYIWHSDQTSSGRAEVPVRVELARAVIARYVNGPLGGDTNCQFKFQANSDYRHAKWHDLPNGMSREDIRQLDEEHVYLGVGHGKMKAAEPEVDADV